MKQYYFVNSQGQQIGPVPMEELRNHNIQRNTPVWCEGMTDWAEAGQVPELGFLFASGPTYGYGQGGYSQGSFGNMPPQNPGYNAPMQKPDNYLVWSILCTVLCCIPFGVAAIVLRQRWIPCGRKADMTRLSLLQTRQRNIPSLVLSLPL